MANVEIYLLNVGTVSQNKYWGEKERVRQATATCTMLVLPDGTRWVVDPSPQPDPLAKKLFDRTGLWPDAVQGVFVTHWHGDHRYGLDLFPDVPWLMAAKGIDEWREQKPDDAEQIARFTPAEGNLPEGVTLVHTPGHTFQHYGIEAMTRLGTLIIAGDSVMGPNFFAAEVGYHNSLDFDLATKTIQMIKRRTDLVIPGHGNYVINKR